MNAYIKHRGFSTLEMLMAMTIIVIVLSAVVVTSFTNQSSLIGSQSNSEAMSLAQSLLETEQAYSRKDFNLVNATTVSDGFYAGVVTVTNPVMSGKTDYFSKKVTATVSWKDEHALSHSVDLSTLVSNFGNTAGGNTCNSSPAGNWNPPTTHTYTLTSLAGVSGSYPITAIDAYLDKLYVTAGPTTGGSDSTLFVFNLSGGVPTFSSARDTSGSSVKGPNGIAVVATTSAASGHIYAYLANGVSPDWSSSSCATASDTCSQLQVVDLGTNATPATPTVVKRFKFATSSVSTPNTRPYVTGTAGQASGQSIMYRNGYVLLGLSKTNSGPEFHVIDVHDPLNPAEIGSSTVARTVEKTAVSGNYAYLSTDDNANSTLLVLDLTDPSNIPSTPKWSAIIPSGIGYGRGMYLFGDTLQLVKTADSGLNKPEWYVLDNSKPSSVKPSVSASADFGSAISLNNIFIRDYLAFITTTTAPYQLLIRNATSTAQYSAPITLPGPGSAIDCEGNFVYVGSGDAAGTITVLGQ